ncbi:MAG: hypothetical protein QOG80_2384 [Pseudonocardiales bacterium]|jgi:hypothetical protein|nr:hypothetical protein [Pseudonocardiales bacterium]
MTGPGDPPPYPHYGQPPPTPPQQPAQVARPRLALARVVRRPDPRFGVSLAGVGVGVAVIGVIIWGGGYLASGVGSGGTSDSHRLLGIFLSIFVTAAGYTLAVRQRSGPLATAGVVASALGVPVLMGFLTFSTSASGSPFSFDAIAVVSIAVWLLSYLFVRGARGHAFYLGLAATLLWIYLLDKAEPGALSPAGFVSSFVPFGIGGGNRPDWGTVSLISFLFGVGYYAVMTGLDRSRRHGAGTPFAISGFLATVVGFVAAAPSLHVNGEGALLIVFGIVLGVLGSRSVRRFTTWAWAGAIGLGIVLLIGNGLRDNNAGAGIALIACGALLVAVGQVCSLALREPPDDRTEAPGVLH